MFYTQGFLAARETTAIPVLCVFDNEEIGSEYYKTFRFSFHGWMEYHAGCLALRDDRFYFNKAGRCMEKGLKKLFEGSVRMEA